MIGLAVTQVCLALISDHLGLVKETETVIDHDHDKKGAIPERMGLLL